MARSISERGEVVDIEARRSVAVLSQQISALKETMGDRHREVKSDLEAISQRVWWLIALLITGMGSTIFLLIHLMMARG